MSNFAEFAPNTSLVPGTPLDVAHLNALVVAASYLISGGVLPTSGSLTATQPATEVVVNNGTTALYLKLTSQSMTLTASKDTYIDLDNTGTYHKVEVANGGAVPAVTANSLRLAKAVTSGSAITAVTALASTSPVVANPAAMATRSTLQSIPSSALTTVVFDTETFDTDGICNLGTHADRLTCQTTGIYRVQFSCVMDSAGGSSRAAGIYLNGSTLIAAANVNLASPTIDTCLLANQLYPLAAGDYIIVQVEQTAGSPRDMRAATPASLSMERVA